MYLLYRIYPNNAKIMMKILAIIAAIIIVNKKNLFISIWRKNIPPLTEYWLKTIAITGITPNESIPITIPWR